MIKRISHIGIVVEDLEAALELWSKVLGLEKYAELDITVEGIRSVLLSVSGKEGEMSIELMEPTDKSDMDNPVARRLARAGEGFYHLAVEVDDVAATGRTLQEHGLRVIERPPVDAVAAGRWLVHPKAANGVMVEGIEPR